MEKEEEWESEDGGRVTESEESFPFAFVVN